ncbi:MAG: class I SAM-dependent methyltransferase, partial [Burkholderiales bacterium]
MLGATLDYYLLRGLAHRRNRATEDQLDAQFLRLDPGAVDAVAAKLRKLVQRFEGHLPLEPSLRYLDVGCGGGELTLALATAARAQVTGVDYLPRNIERARALAARAGLDNQVDFVCRDLQAWEPAQKYDVLLSFDALEHIADPGAFLRRMARFIAPGGVAAFAFGPLFHSPFGDHMWDFFRLQIPWRGVLFSEQALLRLRRE